MMSECGKVISNENQPQFSVHMLKMKHDFQCGKNFHKMSHAMREKYINKEDI